MKDIARTQCYSKLFALNLNWKEFAKNTSDDYLVVTIKKCHLSAIKPVKRAIGHIAAFNITVVVAKITFLDKVKGKDLGYAYEIGSNNEKPVPADGNSLMEARRELK